MCSDGEASQACVAKAGTPYYSTPCSSEDGKFKVGDLEAGYPLSLTGRRSGSICAETNCFAEAVERDAASGQYVLVWLLDHPCGQEGSGLVPAGTGDCKAPGDDGTGGGGGSGQLPAHHACTTCKGSVFCAMLLPAV